MSNKKILKGILSSADIRKAILNHKITNEKINNIYNKRPRFIFKDQFEKDKKISLNIKKLTIVPIIDRKTKKL